MNGYVNETILKWIIPVCLIILGLFGNVFSYIIFSRKALSKFPTRNVYRALALADSIYLLFISTEYSFFYFGIKLRRMSNLSCKLTRFLSFSLGSISAWLLVYISINKYILIRYYNNKLVTQNWFQNFLISLIILYNLFYYTPVMILVSLREVKNHTSNTSFHRCDFETNQLTVINWMDLINFSLVPFTFMFIISILIIYTIFKSRLRFLRLRTFHDRNKFKKDIKFAISSILFNICFIILNLPICVTNILELDVNSLLNDVYFYFFLTNFGINFYILVFSNSIFRKQVFLSYTKETK